MVRDLGDQAVVALMSPILSFSPGHRCAETSLYVDKDGYKVKEARERERQNG